MSEMEDYNEDEGSINYKSISCEEIPELFLDKLVAKNHFSRFGKIKRFILKPKRLCCVVEYETEDQAEKALQQGDVFNGLQFRISYAEKDVAHVQNTEEWVDPEVQAELEAMGSTQKSFMPYRQQQMVFQKPMRMRPSPPATLLPSYPFQGAKPATKKEPEVVKVDPSLKMDLLSTIKMTAFNDEDKYRVLDARDKLIRLLTIKQTDIKKAKATKGTCPDMCPEKERLMRSFQRQVSYFEQPDDNDDVSNETESSIYHKKAIKEYSRSSADQEAPLAHELRSEKTLQLTMLYLLHRIADLCDHPKISLGDWFHFLWDRTRSIRKDITQQELCSLAAVDLVEQCARFHIHCAARLIAEEPSVFDKKINAENLTKCLQTLKYMYHDLRLKKISCPCEAEFRSYIVLLNLGDSNFLFELKQLPPQIQNSNEIQHALKFYMALQNNNYVKFFNLVKSEKTSYLSACIVLRYFHQLRCKAMSAIIKSHKAKSEVFLPLDYLTNILAFEDETSTMDYMEYFGLQCDAERGVLLDRMTTPEIDYSMERALNIVEVKRVITVGECINGRQLESTAAIEQYQPQDSFDSNGVLKTEAIPEVIKNNLKSDSDNFKMPEPKQQDHQFQTQQVFPSQENQEQKFAADKKQASRIAPSIFDVKSSSFARPLFSDRDKDQNSFKSESIFAEVLKKPMNVSQDPFKVPLFNVTKTNQSASSTKSIFGIKDNKTNASILPAAKPSESSKPTSTGGFGGFRIDSNIFNQKPSKTPAALSSSSNFTSAMVQKPASIFGQTKQDPTMMAFQGESIFEKGNSQSIFGSNATESSVNATNSFPPSVKQSFSFKQPFLEKDVKQNQTSFSLFKERKVDPVAEAVAAVERRARELEEEQRLKQLQLEEERKKLKALEEERAIARQLEAKRKAKEAFERKVLIKANQHLNSMILEIIEKIVIEEFKKNKTLLFCTHKEYINIFEEVFLDELYYICVEEYDKFRQIQYLMKKYSKHWLEQCRKRKLQRKLLNSMPVWITTDTLEEQVSKIQHPCQELNLSMIRRYRQGQPVNFEKLLWQGSAFSTAEERPLNLCQFFANNMDCKFIVTHGQLQIQKYVKMIISVPNDNDEMGGFGSLCNSWFDEFIETPPPNVDDTENIFYCEMENNVAVCVRKVSGMKAKNENGNKVSNELDHADCLLFFLTGSNIRNSYKRLHSIFTITKNFKQMPVAFFCYDCDLNEMDLSMKLGLKILKMHNRIGSYEFFGCNEPKNHFSFPFNLKRCVNFLAKHISDEKHNDLDKIIEMQNITEWLDSNLGEDMWNKWEQSSFNNPSFNIFCTKLSNVIEFYNRSLKLLTDMVTINLDFFPEFPRELKRFISSKKINASIPVALPYFPLNWKDSYYRETLKRFLKLLYLPDLGQSFVLPSDMENLEIFFVNFTSRCIPNDDIKSTEAAHEALKSLILQLNQKELLDLTIEERLRTINYLPIVKAIVYTKISKLLDEALSLETIPDYVFYLKSLLMGYQTEPWWLDFSTIRSVKIDLPNQNPIDEEVSKANSTNASDTKEILDNYDQIIQHAEELSQKVEKNIATIRNTNSSLSNSNSNNLKRYLDESFYNFEMATKLGVYTYPSVSSINPDLTDQNSNSNEALPSDTTISPGKKRKREDPSNAADDVIQKAMSVIKAVETKYDSHERLKQKVLKYNL